MNDKRKARPLWTPDELASVTGGRWMTKPGRGFRPIRVSYDTSQPKSLKDHICFMVTPLTWGAGRRESIGRIPLLAKHGAACAIIQKAQKRKLARAPIGFPILVVKDSFKALAALSEASRKRFRGKVISVTGTVGKTTTREMLRHVLDQQGGAVASRWNNNNWSGVLRTMAYTPRDHGYSVIEMGFGRPLNWLAGASKAIRPHAGIITTISNAHLDMFTPKMLEEHSGLELLAQQKSGILDGITDDGVAVIGRVNPVFETLHELAKAKAKRVVTFGLDGGEGHAIELKLGGRSSEIVADIGGTRVEYTIKVPGKHMAVNSLGVLTCAWALGADLKQACEDIGTFEAAVGRAKVADIPAGDGSASLIDDAFNATIISVRSSFELMRLMTPGEGGRRIAVLGDVMHVGHDEVAQHAGLSESVVENDVDLVFTNGPLMKHLHEALPAERRGSHTSTMRDLYRDVRAALKPGDIVAIKSGRGSGGLGDRAFLRLGTALRKGMKAWPDNW